MESTAPEISGLGSGAVIVHIMDDYGCETSATNLILSPMPLVLKASSESEIYGGMGGMAEVTAEGGTMPYTYSWMPGESGLEKIQQMPSGVYTAIVTDANGCTAYIPVNISTVLPESTFTESMEKIAAPAMSANVLVYPNPAQDQFTIKNISEETLNVSVMNNVGQNIYETIRIPANLSIIIPMEEMTPGIYLVRIENKIKVETIRLIKE
jgi:hypothetical protein